jgi:DNA-binding CsgD family transcriptional regulator
VLTARNLDDYLQRCAAVAAGRFDLSDAERRLAEGLLRGLSPSDYADACGIKVSTVRSQLKALFAKCGVARQSDLVLRIGVLTE